MTEDAFFELCARNEFFTKGKRHVEAIFGPASDLDREIIKLFFARDTGPPCEGLTVAQLIDFQEKLQADAS